MDWRWAAACVQRAGGGILCRHAHSFFSPVLDGDRTRRCSMVSTQWPNYSPCQPVTQTGPRTTGSQIRCLNICFFFSAKQLPVLQLFTFWWSITQILWPPVHISIKSNCPLNATSRGINWRLWTLLTNYFMWLDILSVETGEPTGAPPLRSNDPARKWRYSVYYVTIE